MEINDITAIIVDEAYKLHCDVGPGLLESVYEVLLADALILRGLKVARQVPVPIRVKDRQLQEGFRADIIVEDLVIIETKSVERLLGVHKKQVLTYLRFSKMHVGLLINFGGELLKGNIERIVDGDAPNLKL